MNINNKIGPICPHDWTHEEAEIVCRQYGYGFARAVSTGYYPPTEEAMRNGPVIGSLNCTGNEHSFLECPSDFLRNHCSTEKGTSVGVICYKGEKSRAGFNLFGTRPSNNLRALTLYDSFVCHQKHILEKCLSGNNVIGSLFKSSSTQQYVRID